MYSLSINLRQSLVIIQRGLLRTERPNPPSPLRARKGEQQSKQPEMHLQKYNYSRNKKNDAILKRKRREISRLHYIAFFG